MYSYAEIDENKVCFAVSELGCEVNSPTMIPLENYDPSFLGKKYENGQWKTIPKTDIISSEDFLDISQ